MKCLKKFKLKYTYPCNFYDSITIDDHKVEEDAENNVSDVGIYVIEIAETQSWMGAEEIEITHVFVARNIDDL